MGHDLPFVRSHLRCSFPLRGNACEKMEEEAVAIVLSEALQIVAVDVTMTQELLYYYLKCQQVCFLPLRSES